MMTTTVLSTLCCGECSAPLVVYNPSPFVQALRCETPACLARRCFPCRRTGTLVIGRLGRTLVCCVCRAPQQRLAQAKER